MQGDNVPEAPAKSTVVYAAFGAARSCDQRREEVVGQRDALVVGEQLEREPPLFGDALLPPAIKRLRRQAPPLADDIDAYRVDQVAMRVLSHIADNINSNFTFGKPDPANNLMEVDVQDALRGRDPETGGGMGNRGMGDSEKRQAIMDRMGAKLRERVAALEISQAEAARRLGLSAQLFGQYCNGQRQATAERLVKFAEVLETTPNDLLGFSEASDPGYQTLRALTRRLAELAGNSSERSEAIAELLVRSYGLVRSLPDDSPSDPELRSRLAAQLVWQAEAPNKLPQ